MRETRMRVGQLFSLTIGLLALFAVAGLIAGIATLNSLARDRRAVVDRIDPALVATQRFQIALGDQETGVRGFALSGDEDFLSPYRSGSTAAPKALRALYRTASRSQETQDVVAAARAWQSGYAEPTIEDVRSGKRQSKAEIANGKALFDTFRSRVDALTAALTAERLDARRGLADAAGRVRIVVVAFALAIFIAVAATALLLRRTIVRPIRRLADNVRRTAGGHFDDPVHVDAGAREVVELASDVDVMRTRIVEERDDLQRSNAELEQFAYVASHDLQEPLRKVASFTQMLQRRYEGQLDDRADQYIGFAVDGAKRMQDLINDLLAFSRVGRMNDEMELVDCNEIVRHALASLATDDATIEVGELPTVLGEARLLEAVFANLVSNGLKFRGEDPPVVRVSAAPHPEGWCFTVADNGIGIDPEYADRIFVIFQRLHPRSAYEGTGIGLALCRKIIEFHGGSIRLDTDVPSGATFHFTLPEAQ